MKRRIFTDVRGIRDPYAKRILSHLVGADPFAVYRGTPAALSRLTRGLSARQLRTTAPGRAWSIAEILHHLADSELVMGFRYRKALAESGTRLQPFDEKLWARHLRYADSDPKAKLSLFSALRRDHVAMLSRLSAAQWRRFGLHDERGKETVERMMEMMAGHDLNHRRQIAELRASVLPKAKT
jgi:hypothetical protein